MSEMARIEPLPLAELDAQIEAAEDHVRDLKFQRQSIIDAEAQKIATHKVGDVIETRKAKYRITHVGGDYSVNTWDHGMTTVCLFVRYEGNRLFKNGNEKFDGRLYLPTKEHMR